MEPMKPSVKKYILDARPNVTPEDVDAFERLLSSRFKSDPDFPQSKETDVSSLAPTGDETKLRELSTKLFGDDAP